MSTMSHSPATGKDIRTASASVRFAHKTGKSRRAAKRELPLLRAEFEAAVDSFLEVGNADGAIGFTAGVFQRIEQGMKATCPADAADLQEEKEGSEDSLYLRLQRDRTPENDRAWRKAAHALIAATMAKLSAEPRPA